MNTWLRAFIFAVSFITAIAIAVGIVALCVAYGSLWSLVFAVPAFAALLATEVLICEKIFT